MKNQKSQIAAVLFDLDGTLIDTLLDLTNAMNHALVAMGLPPHPPEVCRRMIGNGVRTFAARALPPDRRDLLDDLIQLMLPYYMDHCMEHSRIYDGMTEALEILQSRHIRLAVVTNKEQLHAEQVIAHYFAPGLFEFVVGTDESTPVKPDPAGALRTLDRMGLVAVQALFLGDSDVDFETARNASVPFVGAAWGYRGRDELAAMGADCIIDTPGEILTLLS
ncbi:MAG: HAD-IA family hydrolase [Sedimentisphaerales bacterium]|nr:HAD-IA family hydrolase [Sedimentisphaerales bacterium]